MSTKNSKSEPWMPILLLGGGAVVLWVLSRSRASAATPAPAPTVAPALPAPAPTAQTRAPEPTPRPRQRAKRRDDAVARQAAAAAVQTDLNRRGAALQRAAAEKAQADAAAQRAKRVKAAAERAEREAKEAESRALWSTDDVAKDEATRARAVADKTASDAAAADKASRSKQEQAVTARTTALTKNGTATPQAAAETLKRYLLDPGANWGWKGHPSEVVRKAQRDMGMPKKGQDGIFGGQTRRRMKALGVIPPPPSARRVAGLELDEEAVGGQPFRLEVGGSPLFDGMPGEALAEGTAMMMLGARPPEECPGISLDHWVQSAGDVDLRKALLESAFKEHSQ